jgi:small-conductance mechanosensitive channel
MQYLDNAAIGLGRLSDSVGFSGFLSWVLICASAFELVSIVIEWSVHARRGSPGEVKMLVGFARVVAVILLAILLLFYTGRLQQIGAVVGAFAGLLLGWSLQAPVSGFAAWILITLKRPFRLGDRVLFPSLGLSGDVLEVGLMYTKLNQVGGSVGSEEAIGRHILIPNAMLFGQVAINYTPQAQSAYFLDEVVVRLTYDSDMSVAEKILLDAAKEVTADIIKATGLQPYIRSDMYDYGVYVRLRYMTMAMDRPRISHEISSRVFKGFQRDPRVDFAIPFVYSSRKGKETGWAGAEHRDS